MTDIFTRDVIAASLDAAATEMFDTLRKTAMSPIIYEVLDVGTGVTDAQGALVSSGAGIPSFIGVLDKSITAIIEKMEDDINEGDVFLTNDPNYGGVTHLNDVVVAEPVFYKTQRIAWVASIAHWSDIGGRTPGSMSVDCSEIIAEGLRLPIVRIINQGETNSAVFDIISCNSRLPEFARGDLWAQIAAGRKAAERIRQLCERYSTQALQQAISDACNIGEQRTRAGLSNLPVGLYSIDEPQDDGSSWSVSIKITPNEFIVDLRDAPPEATTPVNTGRDGTIVACQVFFKALTDPARFANAGSFKPLKVLTTPGTVFHAGSQAAHAYYFETRMKLIDMLWHCLASALPEHLPAGHFASIFGTVIAGNHPDTNRRYTMVEPQMGGWGATNEQHGQHAMFSTNHGDTFNCPVEIAEARYGFDVLDKLLTFAPVVDNQFQGGAGLSIRYRLRSKAVLSTGYSHARVPVWSHAQAQAGGVNQLCIHRSNGDSTSYHMASGVQLSADDIVEIKTAYGGSVEKTTAKRY